ncbi:hypothetical protein KFF05_16430 [bacterium SCSIO 12827]|nr:hypothetical protein KFF05_16430 [bacterium SCSIO 12827]
MNFGRLTSQATADHVQSVRLTRPQPDAPICIYVKVNPLSYLHCLREDYEGECGRNDAVNWLHPEDIEDDNNFVFEVATQMVWTIESVLSDFTNELAQALSPEGYSTPEGISVREMEIALDVSADDPHSLVQSLAPTVHRSFSRTLENHYGSSAQGYVERDREQLLVYGFAGPDERVKLYEKTNRRVRLECVFGVKAFKRHGISRSMRHDEGLELGSIIEDVARVAFPHIDLIHSSSRNIPPPPGEPPEVFFANVCKRTRTPERAVDLCRNLIRHGRIRGGFDRGFISRLVADGILRRLQHGVYVVTQTYERAVERLRLLDEEWQSFLWRAAA